MDTTVAILPANFNPAHIGHAEAVNLLLEQFDRVILAPNKFDPEGQPLAPFNQRLRMARIIVERMTDTERVTVSDIQRNMEERPEGWHDPLFAHLLVSRIRIRETGRIGIDAHYVLALEEEKSSWRNNLQQGAYGGDFGIWNTRSPLSRMSEQCREICQNAPSTREVRTHLLPLMGESLTDFVVREGIYRGEDKIMSPAASSRRRAMDSGSLLSI